jgi:acetylglutamate kinase
LKVPALKVLVKLGGTLLDAPESRARLAAELAAVAREGVELVVVHGGGKQMTRYLAERGIESRFVNGLRVTTPETIDAVLKVFAGSVNHELVSALVAAGALAVGLSGIDASLAEAEPLDPALGAVGRVVRANPELLDLLAANGYVPVVACVAGDRHGRVYNVNADQMAVACAAAFGAGILLFLTDVEGVLGADKGLIRELTAAQCDGLIAHGVATGGMQAKLNAASDAVRRGVGQVRIAAGATPGIVKQVLQGQSVGTLLVLGDVRHD